MYVLKFVTTVVAMVFLPLHLAFSASETGTYPAYSFQDGVLTIPRVDTDTQAGYFQDVQFKLQPDGTISLESYTTNELPTLETLIDKVELIKTDTVPVQVFLKVTGPDMGCGEFGQINQRLLGNRFEVAMYLVPRPVGTTTCTASLRPFEKIIPLDVYDLPAGSYETSINGGFTNTFELTLNNKL